MIYKEYEYLLTSTAEDDLDGIIHYIVNELANPGAAKDFISFII